MRELDTGIFILDNYVAHEGCDTILGAVGRIRDWEDHSKGKYTADVNDSFCPEAGAILRERFLSGVNLMLDEFRKHDCDNQIPTLDESFVYRYRFIKYLKGASFHSHFDANTIEEGKMITGIMYLSDDYEGGVLSYPRHDVQLKAKQGDMVFHPAIYTHPHISSEVTSGEKLVCSMFCSIRAIPGR